jgi:SAM-dependent methyltransferase
MPVQHRPELDRWILEAVGTGADSVLDVGCGVGHNGFLLWESELAPRLVGLDVDEGYLRKAEELGLYERLLRRDLARGLPEDIGTFDVVLCTQVLAHLEKDAGKRLLEECERVAIHRVVLTVQVGTPRLRARANPNETDRSQWTAAELRLRGYRLKAFGSRLSRDRHRGRGFLFGFYAGTLLGQLSDRFAEEVLAVREVSTGEERALPA